MGSKIAIVGAFLVAVFPILTVLGLGAHALMECSGGGSSGPVAGCHIFGFEFNLIAAIGTPAFVASFLSVPLGSVLIAIGLVVSAFSNDSPKEEGYAATSKTRLPIAASNSTTAAICDAINQHRTASGVTAVCPSCHSQISAIAVAREAGRVTVSCRCGACNGMYEITSTTV
jgi:hypothetical protein